MELSCRLKMAGRQQMPMMDTWETAQSQEGRGGRGAAGRTPSHTRGKLRKQVAKEPSGNGGRIKGSVQQGARAAKSALDFLWDGVA